ncbi:MAG: ketoacyl-ACP synthase III [Bacteroidota bacterium]
MASFTCSGVRVAGIAACVPEAEISNHDYTWIPEKERNLLIKTTGVEKRRVAADGVTTSDLTIAAANRLLDDMGWSRSEIGILVFVSQSRDYPLPATSCIIQDRMGLPQTTYTIDINQGCSGYIYGLSSVMGLMSSFGIGKGLLMVGDISTKHTSYRDKSAYPLFGDAGTATALELNKNTPGTSFNIRTDGSGYEAIIIPDGGMRNLISKKSFDYKKISEGIYRHRVQLALDGIRVFNFALAEVVPNINELLSKEGISIEDADYLILHQANLLINDTIRRKMKLQKEKVPVSITRFGNTSCASIPLTMVSEIGQELREKPLKMVLSGFGVGLSWGSAILHTDKIICPELIEYTQQ